MLWNLTIVENILKLKLQFRKSMVNQRFMLDIFVRYALQFFYFMHFGQILSCLLIISSTLAKIIMYNVLIASTVMKISNIFDALIPNSVEHNSHDRIRRNGTY